MSYELNPKRALPERSASIKKEELEMLRNTFVTIFSAVALAGAGCATEVPPETPEGVNIAAPTAEELTPKMAPAPSECFGCNAGKEWCCVSPSRPETCSERPCSN